MRTKIIAGNWKMNHTMSSSKDFFVDFMEFIEPIRPVISSGRLSVEFYVPATLFSIAKEYAEVSNLFQIGSQNTNWLEKGAFTGELSTEHLKDFGIQHSLIGHSERRQYFGETNQSCRMRATHLLNAGFQVIFCVGETRAEREAGQTTGILNTQIREGLPKAPDLKMAMSDPSFARRFRIAYEPVWAIGTGLTATEQEAESAHVSIRNTLKELIGEQVANSISILYGGSVTPENAAGLMKQSNIDGLLVGGSSLKASSFSQIAKSTETDH